MAVVSIKQFWLSNEFAGMLITLESLRISLMFIFCLTWCTYTCALTQHMKPFPEFDGVFVSSLICVKKTKPTSSVSKLGVETFHQIVPQFSFYLGQKVVLHMLVQKGCVEFQCSALRTMAYPPEILALQQEGPETQAWFCSTASVMKATPSLK